MEKKKIKRKMQNNFRSIISSMPQYRNMSLRFHNEQACICHQSVNILLEKKEQDIFIVGWNSSRGTRN